MYFQTRNKYGLYSHFTEIFNTGPVHFQTSLIYIASFLDRTVADRLYAEGIEKKRFKEFAKRQFEDKSADFPFHPDVKASTQVLKGEKASQKPLHERLQEIQKQKQEYLLKLKEEALAQNPDLTFQPRLDPLTDQIAKEKCGSDDITNRLLKDADEKFYRQLKAAEEHEKNELKGCTFKPEINPTYDEILQNNEIYKYNKDFVTRQNVLANVSKDHLGKTIERVLEEEGCTFSPRINKVSEFLVEADPERANESIEQKFERLSKRDQQKKEIYQEQIQRAYYDQFTFSPQIDLVSRGLGRKNSLETLAYNKESKEQLLRLRDEAAEKELEGCTFKPQTTTNKKYSQVQSGYKSDQNVLDNIKLAQKKKENAVEQLRKIEEYKQLKECTFKPEIKGDMPEDFASQKLTKVVSGIDKYIQARERAKQLEKEKKEREEKVFHIEKRYSKEKHTDATTPMPFRLSYANKKPVKDARYQQDREGENLTFKPATNEA